MTGDRDTMGGSLNQEYLQRTGQMSDLEKQMYAAKEQGEAAVKAAKDKYKQNLYGMFGDAADMGLSAAMQAIAPTPTQPVNAGGYSGTVTPQGNFQTSAGLFR
jgi:hypothetical protein